MRRGRRRRQKKKKKKSKDRLVARIEFRTVSNDTGQDTTAAMMVPGILLPTFPFFSTVKSRTSAGWDSQEIHEGHRSHEDEESTVS